MDEDLTERLLNLTLEIIFLLTGERFLPVKSGDHLTIKLPSCHFRKPMRYNVQKILEVTQKISELLTGEDVDDFTDKWRDSEENEDHYKDIVMMEDQPPLTSPDGSGNRNPPERCPHPLDSTQEGHITPHHDQSGNVNDNIIIVKEEYKEEDEAYGVIIKPTNHRNPLKRRPHPLFSGDSSQEDDQDEDLIHLKFEGEVEKTFVNDDEQYTEEAGIVTTIIGEDSPPGSSPGPIIKKPVKWRLTSSPDCEKEEETAHDRGGLHSAHRQSNLSMKGRTGWGGARIQQEKTYSVPECGESLFPYQRSQTTEKPHSCPDCGKCFSTRSLVVRHQRSHTGEKPYSCAQCGKSYSQTSQLVRHQRSHTGEKPYSCPECGKCYPVKYELVAHLRSHTGERPYSCPECGKCYPRKAQLVRHQISHSGEMPYTCLECGKCFISESHLYRHQKTHTGEKPHSCSDCGKSFLEKSHLYRHQRTHTGEKPFSCADCGKCYARKSQLVRHQLSHSGEKPYSCSECGKIFLSEANLNIHQQTHTGEKLYSCSDCGKCFSEKSNLYKHQITHTGEKPFPCPECGKCFSQKSQLYRHQITHTGIKRFSCSECGKCFSQKASLLKHQQTHRAQGVLETQAQVMSST